MKYKLLPYSIHELGQRQNQEDSMFPAFGKSTKDDRLFILCDGMGGHEKGEVASATVCEAISNCILSRWTPNEPLSDGLLQQAIEEAYDALDEKDNGEEKKMGTTMTFVCFHIEGVTVAHIGDSRIYQLRPANGKESARIVFQTRDHSLVNDLIRIGEITEEEAKNHPQKNVITRAMQPCQDRRAKAEIKHLTDIQEGDYFYMCSDGMLEQTTDENLLFIVAKPKASNEQKVEMLREVTSENKDNHTAHLIHISKVEGKVAAPIQTNSPKEYVPKPQGTYITPDTELGNTNKRSLFFYVLVGLVAIALIAGGVLYFLHKPSAIPKGDSNENDSIENYIDDVDSDISQKKEIEHIKPELGKEDGYKQINEEGITENEGNEIEVLEQNPTNDEKASHNEGETPNSTNKFILIKKKGNDGKKENNDYPEIIDL